MAQHTLIVLLLCLSSRLVLPEPTQPPTEAAEPRERDDALADSEEPPEGYYAFVESPNATPPRVRPPPYRQVTSSCPEVESNKPHVSANNLCGDLNRGLIPRNPMGQNPNGEPYPFELLRNHTLRFLSRTLPVLRADDTLPRVAHLPSSPAGPGPAPGSPAGPGSPGYPAGPSYPAGSSYPAPTHAPEAHAVPDLQHNRLEERSKRSLPPADAAEHRAADADAPRESRKFCDNGGVFCMLYRAINGDSDSSAGVERREDPGPQAHGAGAPHGPHHRYEGPPTPCPARVEYATPVFARNYQGVWRYVVQIPYEGYFTQTVEVTRCMQSRCHYLDGGCLSSPRWVSLLVAELHYPPAQNKQQEYEQYGQYSRGTEADATDKPQHCDGHDDMGCYQVRLYYDWFLVPGSCKCWRPDYFARYVRRRQNSEL
ncbi:serine/arginine repetitive matrix protein 1 [Spodoptera litura]|uniref:Serine/arginine repetitive matrix protein 1 n=1 Tax=Spodoptera litura TaxID=69820 RepID=A0A9J7EWT3_SPOLT|nr:serine/arginine repetitive matrix protein 1 [Spodoptera litura]